MFLSAELPLLQDFLFIFGLAIGVQLLCHQIKLPPIIGFLLTGVIAGPHFTGLVADTGQVEIMAEIGVILLLFTLGMEFSFRNLVKIRNAVLIGGGVQVGLTILLTGLLTYYSGFPYNVSVFMGFLLALSSTAIVIKLLQQKAQIDSLHGRTVLGILIFQDIIIVPMMLITPLLSGDSPNVIWDLGLMLLKFVGIGGLVFVFSRYLVPLLMMSIARTRTQEIFLMSVITLCFTIAWITSSIGLSLSLGAFLAGLILSESDYSHQALGSVLPFRDIFTSVFFISVGMLLNVYFLYEHILEITGILSLVIVIKLLSGMVSAISLKLSPKTVIMVGLCLFQVGEFAFVLASIGMKENLLDAYNYQLFLSVSVISMMLTPLGVSSASESADRLLKGRFRKGLNKLGNADVIAPETRKWLKEHLIVVGYGLNGKNLAKAARASGIQYIIIETNPDTVRMEKKKRTPIFFGDASQEEVLVHAEIKRAKILVIAISDPVATRSITHLARSLNSDLHIIVRTRYVSEIEPLRLIGANDVVPEEFETSVEIFTRVLEEYLIPRNDIENFIREVRADNYALFSHPDTVEKTFSRLKSTLSHIELKTIRIQIHSVLNGSTLARANIRQQFGINVVAILHGENLIVTPDPDAMILAEDVLYIVGTESQIAEFCKYAEQKIS